MYRSKVARWVLVVAAFLLYSAPIASFLRYESTYLYAEIAASTLILVLAFLPPVNRALRGGSAGPAGQASPQWMTQPGQPPQQPMPQAQYPQTQYPQGQQFQQPMSQPPGQPW